MHLPGRRNLFIDGPKFSPVERVVLKAENAVFPQNLPRVANSFWPWEDEFFPSGPLLNRTDSIRGTCWSSTGWKAYRKQPRLDSCPDLTPAGVLPCGLWLRTSTQHQTTESQVYPYLPSKPSKKFYRFLPL